MGKYKRSENGRMYSAHNNRKNTKNRSRAGFTITEVLLVVAILVVLFAVTIIGISSYQASLRQKELDSKAEVIYMAAQNRLTELAAAGRSDLYQPAKTTTDPTTGASVTDPTTGHEDVREVTQTPYDKSEEMDTSGLYDNLYYVTSGTLGTDAANTAAVIVPADRVEAEIRDNYWVVEFDPSSASVYAVFYSEEKDDYTPETYNLLREKNRRLAQGAKVGYYGGDVVVTIDTSKLSPKIEISNKEKLVATISCIEPYNQTLTFEIKVSDEYGHSWTKTIRSTEMGKAKGAWTYSLTLDSLIDGERFCQVYGGTDQGGGKGGSLIAGSDITIECIATSENEAIDKGTVTATTNSLFDSIDSDGKAVVTYARHLQNLDEASGLNSTTATSANGTSVQKITAAIQKSNIHFEDDKENEDDWYSLYTEKNVEFKAINSPYLDSYEGGYVQSAGTDTEDGTEPDEGEDASADTDTTTEGDVRAIIYGLDAKGGVFSTFYGSTLKDITLVGAKVSNGTSDGISGVAGGIAANVNPMIGKLDITGCQVYLETSDISGKTEEDKWIHASDYVGGLVGKITSGTVNISESFAASVLGKDGTSGTEYTGGLVGYLASGTLNITESYANSYLYGKNVGGLVGGNSGAVNVTNSYVAGFSYATENSAGFTAGKITSATRSYSVLYFDGTADGVRVYGIASSGSVTSAYYDGSSVNNIGTSKSSSEMSGDERATFAQTLGSAFSSETGGSNTHAYNLKEGLALSDYAFPKLASLTHYGDWNAAFENNKLVYYEVYKDTSTSSASTGTTTEGETDTDSPKTNYGFYGASLDKLKKTKMAIGDGYGIIYESESEVPNTVTVKYYSGANASTKTEVTLSKAEAIKIEVDNKTYYLLPLPKEVTNTAYAPSSVYQEIEVGSKSYYYCPHFSKFVTESMPSKAEAEISVRTARQLYNMSLYFSNYADALKNAKTDFTQELNIDYTQYEWTTYTTQEATVTSQDPIGNKNNSYRFYNDYDGGNHTITGVSFIGTTGYYAGLFGDNRGVLENIAIVSEYQANDSDAQVGLANTQLIEGSGVYAYIGTLAGRNSKTIRNCAVTGYTMDVSTYENSITRIGGLVGRNAGKISNSYADIPSVRLKSHYATTNFGGLVGENTNVVQNCYALTEVEVTDADGGDPNVAGFCGANSGTLKNSYCCSAVVTMGSATGYGFAPQAGTISNCFYLNGGSYFYVEKLNSYNIISTDTRVRGVKADVLKTQDISSAFNEVDADASYTKYNNKTLSNLTDKDASYPYPAVYKNANGERVHYGNWPVEASLGRVGMLYWEYEEGGANAGYHFHYIGLKEDGSGTSGTSLCTSHDDGGVVKAYGYAYYIEKAEVENGGSVKVNTAATVEGDTTSTSSTPTGSGSRYDPYVTTKTVTKGGKFGDLGKANSTVSDALEAQLKGFEISAYDTGYGTDKSKSHLYLTYDSTEKKGYDNGQFVLTFKSGDGTEVNHSFTVCPFFADSFTYDGTAELQEVDLEQGNVTKKYDSSSRSWKYYRTDTKTKEYVATAPTNKKIVDSFGANLTSTANEPGQSVNNYQIRSAAQLQYINWNAYTKAATSSVTGKTDEKNTYFSYLKYASGTSEDTSSYNYYWDQTHDVDQNPDKNSKNLFIPIGSMYYNSDGVAGNKGNAWIAFMGGSYDGNSYMVKKIEIDTTNTMVGLFGITIGAKLENIVMYSENGNTINIKSSSSVGTQWYSVGGLVGFAARGTNEQSPPIISNCTVSGYTIKDSRSYNGDWGGGSVGGLAGSSNMNISNCSAVNDILISIRYDEGYKNLRVGGLIGNIRATIDSCYSGGTIKSETGKYGGYADHVSVWTGGINGGILMINYGNLGQMIGTISEPAIISNSYTYVELPKAGSNSIRRSDPIGSLGEMSSSAFRDLNTTQEVDIVDPNLTMYNCYAYINTAQNMSDSDIYKNSNYWNGKTILKAQLHQYRRLKLFNNGESPLVTYDELSAQTSSENLRSIKVLLNTNGPACGTSNNTTIGTANFGFVTITEENGAKINGKYSFPGSDSSLDGANYPFPTILTQQDTSGKTTRTVNVHYGTWPQGGMYWSASRLNFDLLKQYSSGTSKMTVNLTTDKSDAVTYNYYPEIGDVPIEEANLDSTAAAKVVSTGNINNGVREVVISALREGTVRIRAIQGTTYRDLMVTVTAKMILASNPNSVAIDLGATDEASKTVTVELTNKSSKDTSDETEKNYTPGTTWSLEVEDENIATVSTYAPTYSSANNKTTFTVTASAVGETTITATATYKVTLNGEQKEFTEMLTIPVVVTDSTPATSGTDQ